MSETFGPTLETSRLVLRPMQADDVDDLLRIFSDPRVMASFDGILFDRAQMKLWLQRNLDHQVRYGYGLFAVIHKTDLILIGDCGLEVMDVDGAVMVELGYDFRGDYWNQGLATEASAAVRDYAFQALRLPQLVSLIRVGNRASQHVAEKIGMQRRSEFTRYNHQYWKYVLEREEPQ